MEGANMKKFTEGNIEIAYRFCPIAKQTREAMTIPLRRYSILLKNYVFVIDDETKDLIILFPQSDLNRANPDLKQIVFADLRNNLKGAKLEIAEEKPTFADFYRVGFISHMIRIPAK